jgi:uncharacterized membrane protein (DUF106 family)
MSEAILQILLIFAYLAIGLISVTFPIYAICVTYLKQEIFENMQERKKRAENLKRQINELTQSLSGYSKDSEQFQKMEKQVKEYKTELKKDKFVYLTARGAVLTPVIFLVITLSTACMGIYYFYEGLDSFVWFLIGLCILVSGEAIWSIYQTILAVEYAALRAGKSVSFDIFYDTREVTQQIKLEKEANFSMCMSPMQQNVEDVAVYIFIPPEIEVKRSDFSTKVQGKGFTHEGYTLVYIFMENMLNNTYITIGFSVIGHKVGKYAIPIAVKGKGILEYVAELNLQVIE